MTSFNESGASLRRIITEGRLIDSLVDVIRRASRSPYDYTTGIADVEAISAAANSQTAERIMFSFHGRDSDTDDVDALKGLIEKWKAASRICGPGRRTVPFPTLSNMARISGYAYEKTLRDADLPAPLDYPTEYQEQEDLIGAALYMAKYNLESVHQAIVALCIVGSYINDQRGRPKTILAEIDKLRDGLWARARDFSRDEMMFTLVMQDTTKTTGMRKSILEDTLGDGMSIMHFLSQFGQMGSYESAEEERFRKQLKAAMKTRGNEE